MYQVLRDTFLDPDILEYGSVTSVCGYRFLGEHDPIGQMQLFNSLRDWLSSQPTALLDIEVEDKHLHYISFNLFFKSRAKAHFVFGRGRN